MVKKKRFVRKHTVFDENGKQIGIWYSAKELMADLNIASQTYVSDSINKGVYIRPYKRCPHKYLIKLETYYEIYYVEGKPRTKNEYVNLPSYAVPSKVTPNLWLTSTGKIFSHDGLGYYEIIPYLNKYKGSPAGYYAFTLNYKTHKLHIELARTFVDGYQDGYVVQHIDGNTANNRISNLKWVTRSNRMKQVWKDMTEEQMTEYKKKYIEGVKNAHKKGTYIEHLYSIRKNNKKDN